MKSATIAQLKSELNSLEPSEVRDFVLRLAKYKKENKELLTFLLYEGRDVQAFIRDIKEEIDEEFLKMNRDTVYLAKKSLRRLLRLISKYARFIGSPEAEAELLIHFIRNVHQSNIPYRGGAVISNLYDNQLKKIEKLIAALDEDLQFDWKQEFEKARAEGQ